MPSLCNDTVDAYPVQLLYRKVGAFTIVISGCYIFMGLLNIFLIKFQEYQATQASIREKGENSGQTGPQSLVFPVFVRVLWLNSAIVAFVGVVYLVFPLRRHDSFGVIMLYSFVYAAEHLVVEGVALLLMMKGLGWNAAKRVTKWVLPWACIVFISKLLSAESPTSGVDKHEPWVLVINLLWQILLLIFYLAVWLSPPHRLFRRPAAIIYARFWAIFRVIAIVSDILSFIKPTSAAGNCTATFGSVLVFALFEPFVLYFTLLRDSMWWQGLTIRKGRVNRNMGEDIKGPLEGIDINLHSAQYLAELVDDMIHEDVRLLNFAYIELDHDCLLGSGSFSKVYRGRYRKQECAIKIIFTVDLTEEVINRIAAEAHILSQIKHPNVIHIYGVSVLPPSVCIVLELCAFGSLNKVLENNGIINNSNPSASSTTSPSLSLSHLLLTRADRLYLALGCARGLAALHAHNEALVHRDVKSFNYLIDAQFNVKIADLELGTLPLSPTINPLVSPSSLPSSSAPSPTSRFSISSSQVGIDNQGVDDDGEGEGAFSIGSDIDLESRGSIAYLGLKKNEILPNWAAPEVLQSGVHVKASDVYSLAMVLWEILSGQVPFNEVRTRKDIKQQILEGHRPIMPMHPDYKAYISLIERGWHQDAHLRPTAAEVVLLLENQWRNIGHDLISGTTIVPEINKYLTSMNMNEDSSHHRPRRSSSSSIGNSFSGSLHSVSQRLGSGTGSSFLISKRPSHQLQESSRDDFMAEVCEAVHADPVYDKLEASSEAWLLVTSQAPHLIVRVTSAFEMLSGLETAMICGLPLHQLMVGAQTEANAWDQLAAGFKEDGGYQHRLITLHPGITTSRASFAPIRPSMGAFTADSRVDLGNEYSLYSIHSYPILRYASDNDDDVTTDTVMSDHKSSPSNRHNFFRNQASTSSSPISSPATSSSSSSTSSSAAAAVVNISQKSRPSQILSSHTSTIQVGSIAFYALLFSELRPSARILYERNKQQSNDHQPLRDIQRSIANIFWKQPVTEIGGGSQHKLSSLSSTSASMDGSSRQHSRVATKSSSSISSSITSAIISPLSGIQERESAHLGLPV